MSSAGTSRVPFWFPPWSVCSQDTARRKGALLPDGFLVAQLFRKPLAAENLRMQANDQHFLVIATIKDADPSAFGKPASRAPEKIMF